MKCNKCGSLVDEYYHSYKYEDLDYCHPCMLQILVDVGIIEITSYNDDNNLNHRIYTNGNIRQLKTHIYYTSYLISP